MIMRVAPYAGQSCQRELRNRAGEHGRRAVHQRLLDDAQVLGRRAEDEGDYHAGPMDSNGVL